MPHILIRALPLFAILGFTVAQTSYAMDDTILSNDSCFTEECRSLFELPSYDSQPPSFGEGDCVANCDDTDIIDSFPSPLAASPHALDNYRRGNTLLDQGDAPGAETAFRDALKIDPNVGVFWNNLGIALSQQERISEAIEAFHRAANLGDQTGQENYMAFKAWQEAVEERNRAEENHRR